MRSMLRFVCVVLMVWSFIECGSVNVLNETGNADISMYERSESYLLLTSRYDGDEVLIREILDFGCNCDNIICNTVCCYCLLDCPFLMSERDMRIHYVYGNCSGENVPKFKGQSKEVSIPVLNGIMFQRSKDQDWMCNNLFNPSSYRHPFIQFVRFICVRNNNLGSLGIFYEQPYGPTFVELEEFEPSKHFWNNEPFIRKFPHPRMADNPTLTKSTEISQYDSTSSEQLEKSKMSSRNGNTKSNFSINGSEACTVYKGIPRAGLHVFIPCTIQIDKDFEYTCDGLRKILDDATNIFIAIYVTKGLNRTELIPRAMVQRELVGTEMDELGFPEPEESFNEDVCLNVTIGLELTFAEFGITNLQNISLEILKGQVKNGTFIVPYSIVFDTTKLESLHQTRLSKFLRRFLWGKCPDDYCWRDVFEGFKTWYSTRSYEDIAGVIGFILQSIFWTLLMTWTVLKLLDFLTAILDGNNAN